MDDNKSEAAMPQDGSEGFRSQLDPQEAQRKRNNNPTSYLHILESSETSTGIFGPLDYQLDPSMTLSDNRGASAPQYQQFTTHPVSGGKKAIQNLNNEPTYPLTKNWQLTPCLEPRYGPLGPTVRHPPLQHADGTLYWSLAERRVFDATRKAMPQPVGRVFFTQLFASPADRVAGSRRRRRSRTPSSTSSDDTWWRVRKRRRIVYCPSIPPNSAARRRYLTGEGGVDTVLSDNLPLINLDGLIEHLTKWIDLNDRGMLPPVDEIRSVLILVERRSDWRSRRLCQPHLGTAEAIFDMAKSAMYFILTNGEWPSKDLADLQDEVSKWGCVLKLRTTGFENLDYLGTMAAWRFAKNADKNQYNSNPLRYRVDGCYMPGSFILDRIGDIDPDDEKDVLVKLLNKICKAWGYQSLKDYLEKQSSDDDTQSETIGNDRTPTPSQYVHAQAPAPQAPKTQASKGQADSGREDLTHLVDR